MSNRNNVVDFGFNLASWEIKNLFKDTIWIEFMDEWAGGGMTKSGIVIPETVNKTPNYYRVALVLKAGPECSSSIVEGAYLLIPPRPGLIGFKTGPNGNPSLFLKEDDVMAVISPLVDTAVDDLKEF